jgi:hypothetical protein
MRLIGLGAKFGDFIKMNTSGDRNNEKDSTYRSIVIFSIGNNFWNCDFRGSL